MYGNSKHGFEITGKINRKDFGMTYNAITEAGGLTLGEEIKIITNIQVAQLVEEETAVEML
jgi:polyisoprenoid-binding protein YceI